MPKIVQYNLPPGGTVVQLADNTSGALDIESGGATVNEYITIDTTDGSEKITLTNATETIGAIATAISGTFTATQGSDVINAGSSTAFTTELHVGAAVKLVSDVAAGFEIFTVDGITSDTILSLDSNYLGSTRPTSGGAFTDGGELFAVKTGDSQTLFGVEPGKFLLATSNSNLILGTDVTGQSLTTGSNNFLFGNDVGGNITTGEWNIVIGTSAVDGFGISDPDRSIVIGSQAGRDCRDDNVYVGMSAGQSVGADQNVAIGSSAMTVNGPSNSVAIGYSAHKLVTGTDNVAVGHSALDASGSATNCVAVGSGALGAATNNNNIGVGKNAGNAITTGSGNICIGGDSDVVATAANQIAIGADAVTDGANKVRLGNTSVTNIDGEVAFNATSDARTKANVQELALGLDFINALRPVSFTRVHPAEYPAEILDKRFKQGEKVTDKEGNVSFVSTPQFNVETGQPVKDEFDETTRSDGLIAQEVQSVCDSLGFQFNGINVNGEGKLGLQYALLVAPLIAAVKELSSQNESLSARIATLEAGD